MGGRTQDCWRCREATSAIFCARCAAVQPLTPELDLFAVLGLPRTPKVDAAELERRYHEASRAVHPDRHQTASPRERDLSLAASAAVNQAYRTLRDPVTLGRYWLELHGERLGDGDSRVPPGIAADVFETQERLEELRTAHGEAAEVLRREVREIRDRFAARLAAQRAELTAEYASVNGGGPALGALRQRLSEIAYLGTLLGDIDETIGEGLRGTDHRH